MNGRNIFKLFTVLLMLLIVNTISTSALSEDFHIYTPKEDLNVCLHSITPESLVIRNTGDVATSFSLSKSGSGASFVSYSEPFFSLAPGEEKTIQILLAPGNDKGSYSLTTTVQATFGTIKKIKQSIEVNNCANLNLIPKNSVVNVNPCTPARFSIEVKNTGAFVDTFHFSIDKFVEYASISEAFVVLGPGQSRLVDLFINPACEIYGEHKITFSTETEISNFLGSIPLKLNIARNYPYKVDVQEDINLCKFENKVIDVYVENQAEISNVFDLDVNGPGWVEIEHDNLFLLPKQSTVTHLNITPTKAGEFTIKLNTESKRGEIQKSGERVINVEDCFVADVDIEQRKDILVSGESKSYDLLIKNTGTKSDTYTLELDAPEWARLVPGDFFINAGKEKSTYLEVDVPQDVIGDYKITVSAGSDYAWDKDDIILNIISQEKAYKLVIDPSHTRVDFGKDQVKINIKHKGLRANDYDLRLTAPSGVELSENKINLAPGEEKEITLNTNYKDEKDFAVELRIKPDNTGVAFVSKFNIKVGPSWYEKVGAFLWFYKWYFISGLVMLAILIPGIIFAPRILKRLAEKRQIAEEIRRAKEFTKVETGLESVKATSDWKRILKIVLMIIVAGLVVSSLIYVVPGMFKDKQSPIITLDRSGLSGMGNTIIVKDLESFSIPLVIENNYNEDLLFGIEEKVSWIKPAKTEVEVKAGESETVDLMISPTENIEENEYKVDVSVEVDKDGDVLKEAVNVKIIKTTPWERISKFFVKYWLYFVIGLVVLAPVLIIIHKKTKNESIDFVDKKTKAKVKLSRK